jgi:hypothetical protein
VLRGEAVPLPLPQALSTTAAIESTVTPSPRFRLSRRRAAVRAVRTETTGAGSSFMDLPAFCILTF